MKCLAHMVLPRTKVRPGYQSWNFCPSFKMTLQGDRLPHQVSEAYSNYFLLILILMNLLFSFGCLGTTTTEFIFYNRAAFVAKGLGNHYTLIVW